mmetsp:Transcript_46330/g.83759  ORF Transcript_46330/g.83759 Transcript_46330/m.83759 type:complete len:332 (-) Transcript_46330:69-1064(-)
MEVCVEALSGDMRKFEVVPADTVAHVKQLVQEAEGMPPGLPFSLCLGEMVLQDDQALSDCSLPPDARLTMIKQNNLNITVKQLTGAYTSLEVCASDSVETLKIKILENIGVPVEIQRLICKGKQMQDHGKLWDYELQPEFTVSLVVRLGGPPPGPFPHQWISQISVNGIPVPTGATSGPYPVPSDSDRVPVQVPFNNGTVDMTVNFHDNSTTLDPSGKSGFIDLHKLDQLSFFALGIGEREPYEQCKHPSGLVQSMDAMFARMHGAVEKGTLLLPSKSEVMGLQLSLQFEGVPPNTVFLLGTTSLASGALRGTASDCFRNPQCWQLETGDC